MSTQFPNAKVCGGWVGLGWGGGGGRGTLCTFSNAKVGGGASMLNAKAISPMLNGRGGGGGREDGGQRERVILGKLGLAIPRLSNYIFVVHEVIGAAWIGHLGVHRTMYPPHVHICHGSTVPWLLSSMVA